MAAPTLDGYSALTEIGSGGLGTVFRGIQLSTGATVAVKVLRDTGDPTVAHRRLRREVEALVEMCGHPHVIGVREVVERGDMLALIMEYASGGSIGDLLRATGGTLNDAQVASIGQQCAAALASAHQLGIVHRDVKPHNLLIDRFGRVKLCDFGIAALERSAEHAVRTGSMSYRYASPEELDPDDARPIGPATDVYSLGATLLHLRHGAPPTTRERLVPWTPPVDGADHEVTALDVVIRDCLRPRIGARPTAAELVERLGAIVAASAESPELPPATALGEPGREVTESTVPALALPAPGTDPFGRSAPLADLARRSVPRRRLVPVAIFAVVAAVAGAVAVATVVTRSGPGGASVTVAPRPAGLDPIESSVWPRGEIGGCLVQTAGGGETDLVLAECAAPHDLQRVHVGSLGDLTTGSVGLAEVVRERCRAATATIIESVSGTVGLVALASLPSVSTWAQGDRVFECFVAADGSRLVGDARQR